MKGIKMLYVFVDIKIDASHFVDTVKHNFEPGARLAILSTIQFVATLQVSELFELCAILPYSIHSFNYSTLWIHFVVSYSNLLGFKATELCSFPNLS